jgi:hypothetical protein
MYCPKCRAENRDDIKFCRVCGANLSLISQALSGDLPIAAPGKHGRKDSKSKSPTMESAIQNFFGGIGFICVSFAVLFFAPAGKIWWFWMLIPAFSFLGKGVAEYYSVKQQQPPVQQANQFPQYQQPAIPPPPASVVDRPRHTGELVEPPPSVTESTTKLFDPPGK